LAPATLTVNTTADDPTPTLTTALTLRDAITLVNNAGNPASLGQSSMPAAWAAQIDTTNPFGTDDTIAFDIPTTDPGYNSATGAFAIQPLSALPPLTDTVVLDGYTQPGASPNTLTIGDNAVLNIVLDGSQAGAADGLVIEGGNSTVRGLVIDNFAAAPDGGLVLSGGGNDLVTGNFIGTDATGEAVAGNSNGIINNSPGNTIGGTSPGDRNIASGNATTKQVYPGPYAGIYLGSYGSLIEGNYIGTDKNGATALGNYIGIQGGNYDTIGGTSAGAGNVISGNADLGITLGDQNLIAGNLIGTTADGLSPLGNGNSVPGGGQGGIIIYGNNNTIGGTTPGTRNIISDNTYGVGISQLYGSPGHAEYNVVEGNYIGTDITGTVALGNGIGVSDGGDYTTIGGTSAAARNIISGNYLGIKIATGAGGINPAYGNVVQGNYIGTDVSGTHAIGSNGILVLGATYDNTIGGTLPGEGNLISGGGVFLEYSGYSGSPTNNLIQGNLIGTDKTGTVALGGQGIYGIYIQGANNNLIGGTTPGAGNIIAFSSSTNGGVDIESGTGDSILGNSIFMNSPLGIFLNSANNANDDQAAPVLTSASSSTNSTTISGTLASVANTTFRIEFFANQGLDHPSGNAEGQTFLGFATVRTDASGYLASSPDGSAIITNPDTASAAFMATNLAAIPPGEGYVTATATNQSTGDTSQFSNYLAVPTSMVLTASAIPAVFGQPVTFTATVSANFSGFGMPTGSVAFVDTTTNTALGSATLSGGTATLTTAALNSGTQVITATYPGSTTFLGSAAVLTLTVTPSILVLDPSAGGALTVSGNAGISVPGAVVVDSNSKTALTANGNASVKAGSIQVVGGVSKSGNATLSPAATTGVAVVADPLAGLVVPVASTLGLTSQGSVSLSGNSTKTISPGIYSQITVSGNASLTLQAGVYIITGGGLTVTGSASINGTGVTIYNAGSNYPSSGGNFGGITLSGGGTFSLTAATTGTYAGILIFQSRQNTRALSFSGNAMAGMSGTIYAASALLSMSGNASLANPLDVGMLNLSGNIALTQIAAGSDGTGDTSGIANTLLAGNLTVYINDPDHLFTADELARIQDAINAWDAILAPYSVTITEVSDPTQANLTIDTGSTSACGSAANGVLGCYNAPNGEITMLQGWNWYAGSDPTQIAANQYDFETTVLHELGHALGLGGSTNPSSPMYEVLAAGVADRTPTTQDLNIPDPPTGADPQMAAGFVPGPVAVPVSLNARGAASIAGGVPGPAGFLPLPSARGQWSAVSSQGLASGVPTSVPAGPQPTLVLQGPEHDHGRDLGLTGPDAGEALDAALADLVPDADRSRGEDAAGSRGVPGLPGAGDAEDGTGPGPIRSVPINPIESARPAGLPVRMRPVERGIIRWDSFSDEVLDELAGEASGRTAWPPVDSGARSIPRPPDGPRPAAPAARSGEPNGRRETGRPLAGLAVALLVAGSWSRRGRRGRTKNSGRSARV
jgi:hypothetical protein